MTMTIGKAIKSCTRLKSLAITLYLLPIACWAQTITGISANVTTANMKEPVRVTVNLDLPPDKSPWCGLALTYGDGSRSEHRIEDKKDLPFVVSHGFANPGPYTIRVEGKGLIRGLRSASACDGSSMTVAISVVDPAVERERIQAAQAENQRKRELAERERELLAREDEVKRRDQEVREKSAKMEQTRRLRELEDREKAIQAREAEVRNRESTVKRADAQPKKQPPISSTTTTPKSDLNPLNAF